jgi:uncharacterized protein
MESFLFIIGLGVALFITITGYFNAANPVVKNVRIETEKKIEGYDSIKVVLVTDIHMGAIIGNSRIKKMIGIINELKPDIVLFAGDLVDHNPLYVKAEDMGRHFLALDAPMGIYAVAGNHEFIGHAEISIEYLQKFGIQYIRDSLITLPNGLQIAGRDDRDKMRFDGNKRKELGEVLNGYNRERFIILMDHQPVEFDAVEKAGVDLMVSGHTHKGQVWPFGFITPLVYENDYGLLKKAGTFFYTSSGFGTWGPPVRTGNRPEIVEIIINLGKVNN